MKKLSLLIITLLISSCASTTPFGATHYKVTKQVVGYQCPNNHYLGSDYMCHKNIHISPKKNAINTKTKPNTIKRLKTAKKALKVDCSNVFKVVNQCSK